MKTKLALIIAAGLLGTTGVMAALPDTDLYSSREMSLDALGFYGSRNKSGANTDAWGIGGGLNYFFTKYIGAGADTYADAFELPYLINGSGILRYPIENTGFAPYGFGGGGREWTHAAQWQGHIGVGIEYRWKPELGTFFDAREVFPEHTKDYAVLRFGFRIRFQ